MLIRHFYTPGLAINSYLIFDEEAKLGAVIDPTRQVEQYLAKALAENVEITDIIETHVHADFVSGAPELKTALYGKPTIHCSGMGGKAWIPKYADHIVQDHDEVHLGSLKLSVRHTPGHTPEHVMWLAYDERRSPSVAEVAFTGDLLFVGSVGRPDLLGPEAEQVLIKQLYRTLFQSLHPLPDFLEVLPAHGAGSLCGKEIGTRLSSTLGYEKRCNPWLVPQEFDKWQRKLLMDNPSPPKYFSRMKQLNVNGMTSAGHLMPVVMAKESITDCATCCVIDTRSVEAFAACHLKGALNVPFLPHFPLWAGGVIPENMEIILVVHLSIEAYPVIQALKLIGIDTIKGICEAGHWKCSEGDALLTSSPLLSVNELRNKINDYYVLDVRTPAEWNEGHIDGAYHIELAAVPHSLKEIRRDQPIAVICRSGNRASIAASYLSRSGYQHVVNVKGGMQAWWDSK